MCPEKLGIRTAGSRSFFGSARVADRVHRFHAPTGCLVPVPMSRMDGGPRVIRGPNCWQWSRNEVYFRIF